MNNRPLLWMLFIDFFFCKKLFSKKLIIIIIVMKEKHTFSHRVSVNIRP